MEKQISPVTCAESTVAAKLIKLGAKLSPVSDAALPVALSEMTHGLKLKNVASADKRVFAIFFFLGAVVGHSLLLLEWPEGGGQRL